MIRYDLRCERGHTFDIWFQSSASCDTQMKRKLVSCPTCGSTDVDKAIMAPKVARARASSEPSVPATVPDAAPDSAASLMLTQHPELRAKLRELRDHIVKNADDVGGSFPEEARKMHYGDIEHRPIYGEASLDEAKSLVDEGIEILPVPVLPDDRN